MTRPSSRATSGGTFAALSVTTATTVPPRSEKATGPALAGNARIPS
jgi:hypothetical protein